MTFEPTWSMPLPDWQPTGSFREGVTPPSAGPVDGTLVQLPCINQDWLPLVLGSLDQLRNPSSWLDTLSDAARESVLGQVDYLRSLVAMALNVPCCDVQIRLEPDCVLQFSVDGGATWADVAGWADNFARCVQNAIIPPVPPLPPGETPDQQACGLADWLAGSVIQGALAQAVNSFNTNQSLLEYLQGLIPILAFDFPITVFAIEAFAAIYTIITSSNLADFAAASTDPILRSKVKCCIYDSIRATGYVTSVNYSGVSACLHAMTYTYSDVRDAVAAFWDSVGLEQLQKSQLLGVYNVADCTECVGWCQELNVVGVHGGLFTLGPGVWNDGVGIQQTEYVPGGPCAAISGEWCFGAGVTYPITRICVGISDHNPANTCGGAGSPRVLWTLDSTCSVLTYYALPTGVVGDNAKICVNITDSAIGGWGIHWWSDFTGYAATITYFQVEGTHAPEPGAPLDNCSH